MKTLKRILCCIIGHRRVGDDTWAGYGWTCPRCGHNDFSIHDM